MKYSSKQTALLLLEDGTVFQGKAIGKIGTHGGEICFNTGMTGYQEIYTDPSYYGQIIVNTTSHIGNYGVVNFEQESDSPKISGLVVNSFSEVFSRNNAESDLQRYLETYEIVGISEVDTRRIVRHIRSKGAMNAIISSDILDVNVLRDELAKIPSMAGLELSSEVSTKEVYSIGDHLAGKKVAVLDLGVKKSILNNFLERNVHCKVFPARTTFEEMQKWEPDGYFISNGPGDPAVMQYAVDTTRKIVEADKPVFGICLGHQILALSAGAKTYKMHHGHRGINHPVKNLITGKCEITSQNHGFGVDAEALKNTPHIQTTHINLNDNTVEGLQLKDKKAFSVQYHPESSPGPHDSWYLFDNFLSLMNK